MRHHRKAIISAACLMLIGPTAVALEPSACPGLYPDGVVPFTGLYPAIEKRLPLNAFARHQIVEIDDTTMTEKEFRAHVLELQRLPARVSVYHVGGHCYITSDDCARLEAAGIRLGTTGSWNWDKEERRILDIDHPVSISRLAAAAERGWTLGANYIRIDNLHAPAGSAEPRTAEQMQTIFAAIHAVEDRLRASGIISKSHATGVVAHNALDVWEQLIKEGRLARPPAFLTSERTAQLAFKGQGYRGDQELRAGKLDAAKHPEIAAGSRIALKLAIPYSVAEFALSHDLAGKAATTFRMPRAYIDKIRAVPGVSDVIVIPNESSYVGRGTAYGGLGPRTLAAGPFPDKAGAIAAACMAR